MFSQTAQFWSKGVADHPCQIRLAVIGVEHGIRADADGREHGAIAHHPTMTHLFVARVEDQVFHLAERAVAPGFQLVIEQFGRTATCSGHCWPVAFLSVQQRPDRSGDAVRQGDRRQLHGLSRDGLP
jgi:hypothetical protein